MPQSTGQVGLGVNENRVSGPGRNFSFVAQNRHLADGSAKIDLSLFIPDRLAGKVQTVGNRAIEAA